MLNSDNISLPLNFAADGNRQFVFFIYLLSNFQ